MKNLMFLLINALRFMLELAAEHLNIVKYAISDNAFLFNSKGIMEKFILYKRLGKQEIRCRPAHFNIKDPAFWEGRYNRFKAYIQLCRTINHDLQRLYEFKPERITYYNLLLKQLNKFWDGGPAPAPYTFTPGVTEVTIGNGTMSDARNVSFTASAGGHLLINWETTTEFPEENADDILQVMLITADGSFGIWLPICGPPETVLRRKDGATGFDWIIPPDFLTPIPCEAFCAIKFQSGKESEVKVNGNFIFPIGITPIMLIP
jgi:hypothetical protein